MDIGYIYIEREALLTSSNPEWRFGLTACVPALFIAFVVFIAFFASFGLTALVPALFFARFGLTALVPGTAAIRHSGTRITESTAMRGLTAFTTRDLVHGIDVVS